MSVKILNVALKILTLGSRFGVLLGLAYYLQPSDVGRYGLITAAITFAVYVSGWELYNLINRGLDFTELKNKAMYTK